MTIKWGLLKQTCKIGKNTKNEHLFPKLFQYLTKTKFQSPVKIWVTLDRIKKIRKKYKLQRYFLIKNFV